MQNSQQNNLSLGLNKDTAYISLPPNCYTHANDAEFTFNEQGEETLVKPKQGTTLKFSVPDAGLTNQIFRIKTYCDTESTTIDNSLVTFSSDRFICYDTTGVVMFNIYIKYGIGWTPDEPSRTFANIKSAIEDAFLSTYSIVVNVTQTGTEAISKYASIEFISNYGNYVGSITQQTQSEALGDYPLLDLVELQDFNNVVAKLQPIAYTNNLNYGFVVSVSENNLITEIGVVNEDNDWSYTRVLRTTSFIVSKTQKIDINVEEQNDGTYALYFNDFNIKPKTVYIPSTFAQDCCLQLTPTEYQENTRGAYNLNNTDEQTNTQLVNNIGHLKFKKIIESGGNVTTGGKAFAVRFGINNNATTEWSYLTNDIPVVQAGTGSKLAWVNIQGTKVGEPTSKIVVLTVKNAKPTVFNFVELAVLEYTSEKAGKSYILGKFDVSSNEFDIEYTGNEQKVLLDSNEFLKAEPIIEKAQSQEIKGQRLNLANVILATEDPKWATISENAVLGTERFEIENVGKLPSTDGNQRFKGFGSNFISDIQYNDPTRGKEYKLDYTNIALVPPASPPAVYSSGQYTVGSSDTPIIQIGLSGIFQVKTEDSDTIFAGTTIYYDTTTLIAFKIRRIRAGVTTEIINDNILDKYSESAYIENISLQKLYNIETTIGDILEFWFGIYQGSNFIGTINATYLTINQGANVSSFQYDETTVGEYQLPFNVANKSGYMVNDYRFVYAKYHLKNGYTTAAHPIGRYTEDDKRFVKGLHKTILDPTTSLTDIFTDTSILSTRKVYNYSVKVRNLDITDVRSELAGISFWVSDDIGAVLGTGLYLAATNIDGDNYWGDFTTPIIANSTPIERYFGHFISQDLIDQRVEFATGDKLLMLGVPRILVSNPNYKSGLNLVGTIEEFLGSTASYNKPAANRATLAIQDAISTAAFAKGDLIYNEPKNIALSLNTSTTKNVFNNARGVAISTTLDHQTVSPSTTDHVNMAQYTRNIDIYTLDYRNYTPKFTGDIFIIENNTPNLFTTAVYGGGVYTQKTIRKINYWQTKKVGDVETITSEFITYYAQNRVNAQLYFENYEASKLTYNLQGTKSIYNYLFPFTAVTDTVEEQFNFDKTYIAESPLQNSETYNPMLSYPSKLGVRIYYSDKKIVGGYFDGYRKFRALNYRDLEQKNGDIVAIFGIRDQMVCIQPSLVCGIPYDTDTQIKSDSTADIYIGNGVVYANKVINISSQGSSLKSLTLKGYNVNGNPQVYWLSDIFKQLNRYDYSGNKVLSDINNLRTYFKNNMNLVQNELDANLYYDVDKKNVVVTVRANKIVPEWTNTNYTYDANNPQYVQFVAAGQQINGIDQNFELIPIVYKLLTNISAPALPPYQDGSWEKIPFTNTEFYNQFSIIYDEKTDNFTSHYSPLQKRYFNHNNKVLSPRGVGNYGLVYEMNNGNVLEYFDDNGNFKQGSFELDIIVNKNGTNKRYINVNIDNGETAKIDADVSIETDLQSSICTSHEQRGTLTYYKVKPTATQSIFGAWAKIKIRSLIDMSIKSISVLFDERPLKR